jgi:hypothetical protein
MQRPLIQKGNITSKLIAALGVHGKVAAPELGELVHPVVMVEDLTKASWYNQEIERPAFASNIATPTAGQFQAWVLNNPIASGVVAIVDSLTFWIANASNAVNVSLSNIAPTGAVSPVTHFRDTLLLPNQTPACQMINESNVAIPGGFALYILSTSSTNLAIDRAPGVILAPGWSLRIDGQLASAPLAATFLWRERFLSE